MNELAPNQISLVTALERFMAATQELTRRQVALMKAGRDFIPADQLQACGEELERTINDHGEAIDRTVGAIRSYHRELQVTYLGHTGTVRGMSFNTPEATYYMMINWSGLPYISEVPFSSETQLHA